MSEGGDNNPWAWLGLLKWSLSYTDGTSDASDAQPMSDEDRAFLEKVMQEGIIDENERMKTLLKLVADTMTQWQKARQWTDAEEEQVNEWLQELRDFVEQIDYARSFAAMKGLEFLLGCVQQRHQIPPSTRSLALGILATLSSNNPPVQKQLLELGALKILTQLFFAEYESAQGDANGKLRAKIIQAMGAVVRSHELAEAVFGQLEQSTALLMAGLGMGVQDYAATPRVLRQRTLFLLQALVTSDVATTDSIRPYAAAIGWVATHVVDDAVESSAELREMALAMLQTLLEQNKLAEAVQSRQESLAALGVRRVAALRALTGEEREYAQVELDHWESLLVLLARTAQPNRETSGSAAPLLLAS